MSKPATQKTVHIIATGIPGDKSVEPNAIYYKVIRQAYEMTFDPNDAKQFSTFEEGETFRLGLEGPKRFTVVEHVILADQLEMYRSLSAGAWYHCYRNGPGFYNVRYGPFPPAYIWAPKKMSKQQVKAYLKYFSLSLCPVEKETAIDYYEMLRKRRQKEASNWE